MLKILIVDDDMLTRKGIRMMMPWAAHQMEIVGEAANGKEAQLLLKNTDDSIQSIAFSVGYHDEKYFSRLFKKVTGQSPSEYRKQ